MNETTLREDLQRLQLRERLLSADTVSTIISHEPLPSTAHSQNSSLTSATLSVKVITMITLLSLGVAALLITQTPSSDGGAVLRVVPTQSQTTAVDTTEIIVRTDSESRHVSTVSPAYKLIPLDGVITADNALLRSLGAVVTDSTVTLRVVIPQKLTAGLRSMLRDRDITVDGDVMMWTMNVVIDTHGIRNDGQEPVPSRYETVATPVVAIGRMSARTRSEPMTLPTPMMTFTQWASVSNDAASLYRSLIPVRIDVPKLDDAHDPVIWTPSASIADNSVRFAQPSAVVSPMPARDRVTVTFTSDVKGDVDLRIVDLSGRIHLQQTRTVTNGETSIDIDITTIPSGSFVVTISRGSTTFASARLLVL